MVDLIQNQDVLKDPVAVLSPEIQADLARMGKVAAGDRAAMKSVFEDFSGPLGSFVKNWLANPHDAADVVSDVMMEVWKNANRYGGRAALRTWIFTIARNKAVDHNRKGARLYYTDQVPDTPDLAKGAVDVIASSQDSTDLKAAMETLSPPHRRAIHLAFFEDMGYSEIARIEDCPVGTIKTRILHAKKLLMREVVKRGRN